ncbi:Iron siderophore sensor protein, partial [Pseudomonas sp. FEN]
GSGTGLADPDGVPERRTTGRLRSLVRRRPAPCPGLCARQRRLECAASVRRRPGPATTAAPVTVATPAPALETPGQRRRAADRPRIHGNLPLRLQADHL